MRTRSKFRVLVAFVSFGLACSQFTACGRGTTSELRAEGTSNGAQSANLSFRAIRNFLKGPVTFYLPKTDPDNFPPGTIRATPETIHVSDIPTFIQALEATTSEGHLDWSKILSAEPKNTGVIAELERDLEAILPIFKSHHNLNISGLWIVRALRWNAMTGQTPSEIRQDRGLGAV